MEKHLSDLYTMSTYAIKAPSSHNTQPWIIFIKDNGIWPCTFVGYCSEVCPKNVDPAGAIQQAKAQSSQYWLKGLISGKE